MYSGLFNWSKPYINSNKHILSKEALVYCNFLFFPKYYGLKQNR